MIYPTAILKEYLVGEMLLQTPSGSATWPVYLQSLPDGNDIEDDACCLFDIVGSKDGRLMIGTFLQHFGVQLKVRSKEYQDGWNKINAIAEDLDFISNEDVEYDGNTYRLHNVSRNVITPLGTEEGMKRRWLFTINFLVTISQIL